MESSKNRTFVRLTEIAWESLTISADKFAQKILWRCVSYIIFTLSKISSIPSETTLSSWNRTNMTIRISFVMQLNINSFSLTTLRTIRKCLTCSCFSWSKFICSLTLVLFSRVPNNFWIVYLRLLALEYRQILTTFLSVSWSAVMILSRRNGRKHSMNGFAICKLVFINLGYSQNVADLCGFVV